jgi:RNA polymerase sigma-70 factor (ECF subfamily)
MQRVAAVRMARAGGRFPHHAPVADAAEDARIVALAVVRAKAGDRDALHDLYVRYSATVYRYVRTIVRDEYEAEDVTQHVFAKLIAAIDKYEQRGSPFAAWILRLAHNVAIDHLRTCRATPAADVFASDVNCDDDDRFREVREALERLPDDQREVVLLRHLVGLLPGEIATLLGRSESSIHGLHHRGRRALQAELRRLDRGPATRCGVAA